MEDSEHYLHTQVTAFALLQRQSVIQGGLPGLTLEDIEVRENAARGLVQTLAEQEPELMQALVERSKAYHEDPGELTKSALVREHERLEEEAPKLGFSEETAAYISRASRAVNPYDIPGWEEGLRYGPPPSSMALREADELGIPPMAPANEIEPPEPQGPGPVKGGSRKGQGR